MKEKQQECPPVGAPGWMTTYGDMMTLLLTFFALLLSFSTIEQTKFEAAIASLREGMGFWPAQSGVLSRIKTDQFIEKHEREVDEVLTEVIQTLEQLEMMENVEVYNTPEGIRIIISDPLPFESGKAVLREGFRKLLIQVSSIISETELTEIRVEGHTDNVPISTPQYPSNWELSAARALAVTKFMAFEGNINPSHLSAVGFGEYRPRASNETSQGRAKNRRVEIYLERRTNPYYQKFLE